MAASEFDSNDGDKKAKAKKATIKAATKKKKDYWDKTIKEHISDRDRKEAATKTGKSVKQVKVDLRKKGKAQRKAVRTGASVGRPERVAKKEIEKAIIKKNRKYAKKLKKAPKVKSQKQIKKSMKDAIIRKNKARKL